MATTAELVAAEQVLLGNRAALANDPTVAEQDAKLRDLRQRAARSALLSTDVAKERAGYLQARQDAITNIRTQQSVIDQQLAGVQKEKARQVSLDKQRADLLAEKEQLAKTYDEAARNPDGSPTSNYSALMERKANALRKVDQKLKAVERAREKNISYGEALRYVKRRDASTERSTQQILERRAALGDEDAVASLALKARLEQRGTFASRSILKKEGKTTGKTAGDYTSPLTGKKVKVVEGGQVAKFYFNPYRQAPNLYNRDYTILATVRGEEYNKKAQAPATTERPSESKKTGSDGEKSIEVPVLGGTAKIRTQEEADFYNNVAEQQEREKEFFSPFDPTKSQSGRDIRSVARFLTFGGRELDPTILRDTAAGRISENIAVGFMTWPYLLGGALSIATEKTFLTGQAAITLGAGEEIGKERQRALEEVEAGPFSFLPGGTPINEEGVETIITAGLFAAPGAAGKVLQGKGGFGPDFAKIVYRTVKIPTEQGQSVRYRGLAFETKTRSQPLIGIGESKPTVRPGPVDATTGVQVGFNRITPGKTRPYVGTPEVNLKGIPEGKGAVFEDPTAARILQKSLAQQSGEPVKVLDPQKGLEVAYPEASAEILAEARNVIRGTEKQKSAFIRDTVDLRTETLSEPGVIEALKFTVEQEPPFSFTRETQSFTYGSFAFQQQAPADIILARGKVAGDLDVQVPKSTAEVSPAVDKLVLDLRKAGDTTAQRATPEGTLIEAQGRHAVDIHTKDTAATDALAPNFASNRFFGFDLNQKTIKIEGFRFQSASEQGVRKGTSIFTLRETPEGKQYFAPEAHRSKDVADFFLTQETLYRSKGLSAEEARARLSKLREFYPEEILKDTSKPEASPPPTTPANARAPLVVSSQSVRVSPGGEIYTLTSPGPGSKAIVKEFNSPSPSRSISYRSISPSSISVKSVSPSPSPSRSVSTSPSQSPSPYTLPSISPSVSPSVSQSPSSSISPSSSPSRSPSPSRSVSPSPSSTGTTTPPSVPIFPSPGRKKKQEGVELLVRRRGVFQSIAKGLDFEEAVKRGSTIVGTTAAASFKVVGEKRTGARGLNLLGSRFRKSKKDPDVIVEKSRFRISSPGEIAEITRKGQAAKKGRKKKSKGGFLWDF